MTDATENLVLRHLQELRAEIKDIRNEMKTGFARIEDQLLNQSVYINSMGKQLGELTTSVYSKHGEMDELRQRIARIERRLEIAD